MAKEHTIQSVATLLADFVVHQRGVWEHGDWEALCARVRALGVPLDADMYERLGMILEHMRVLYFCMPAQSEATAETRAKPKETPKAKTT